MALPTTNIGLKQVYDAVSNSLSTGRTFTLSALFTGDTQQGIYINPFNLNKPHVSEYPFGYFMYGQNYQRIPVITRGIANFLGIHGAGDINQSKFNDIIGFFHITTHNEGEDFYTLPLFFEELHTPAEIKNMLDNDSQISIVICRYRLDGTFIDAYNSTLTGAQYGWDYAFYDNGFNITRIKEADIVKSDRYGLNQIVAQCSVNNWKKYFFYNRPGSYYPITHETPHTVITDNQFRLGDFRGYDKDLSAFGRLVTVTKRNGNRFGYTATLPAETTTAGAYQFSHLAYYVLQDGGNTVTPYYYDNLIGSMTTGNTFNLSISNLSSQISINFDVDANHSMQYHNGMFLFANDEYKIGLPNFRYNCCVIENNTFIPEKYSEQTWFQPYPYINSKSTSGNTSYKNTETTTDLPNVNISNKAATFQVTFQHQLPATLSVPNWITASTLSLPDKTTGSTSGETVISFTASTNTANRTGQISLTNTQYALYGFVNLSQTFIARNITVRVDYIYKAGTANYSVTFTITNNTGYADTIPYRLWFIYSSPSYIGKNESVTGTMNVGANSSGTNSISIGYTGATAIRSAWFDEEYFDGTVTFTANSYMDSTGYLILP